MTLHKIYEEYISKEAFLYRINDEINLATRPNCKSSINTIIKIAYEIIQKDQHEHDTVNMSERFFEVFYLELIYNYLNFVQQLPEVGLSDNMSDHHLMAEQGLARAAAMMTWVYSSIEDIANKEAELGGIQKILYIIFSSALLYEIGSIEQERSIILCNKYGHFINKWAPLQGNMQNASHYKIRYNIEWDENLKQPLTHCFAKQLMPKCGMEWIEDSKKTEALWFKLLTDFIEGFFIYKIEFKWEYLDALLEEHLHQKLDINKELPEDTLIAEIFWEWLKKNINNASFQINNLGAELHILHEGLLLDIDLLYNQFIQEIKIKNISKAELCKQLNIAGFADSLNKNYYVQYPNSNNENSNKNIFLLKNNYTNTLNGILFNRSYLISALSAHAAHKHVNAVAAESWLQKFLKNFNILNHDNSLKDNLKNGQ